MKYFASLIAILLMFSTFTCFAEIYEYTDNNGTLHFTDDVNKVPKKFREKAKNAAASPHQAAASDAAIPEMQVGKWKLRLTKEGGSAKDSEICGDPIDGFSREVQDYAASTKWGCTMTTTASGPRSVIVVYDCPSDRSPDGRPVSKGRSELSLVSASPQAFRIDMKSTVYPGYVMEGSRIGSCEQ